MELLPPQETTADTGGGTEEERVGGEKISGGFMLGIICSEEK